MLEIKKLESEVKSVQFGYWDDEKDEFIPITNGDENGKIFGVSDFLIDSICGLVDRIGDSVHADLESLWGKIGEKKD